MMKNRSINDFSRGGHISMNDFIERGSVKGMDMRRYDSSLMRVFRGVWSGVLAVYVVRDEESGEIVPKKFKVVNTPKVLERRVYTAYVEAVDRKMGIDYEGRLGCVVYAIAMSEIKAVDKRAELKLESAYSNNRWVPLVVIVPDISLFLTLDDVGDEEPVQLSYDYERLDKVADNIRSFRRQLEVSITHDLIFRMGGDIIRSGELPKGMMGKFSIGNWR